jgi:hypothetical protein
MADNKYGRVFTGSDVEKILEYVDAEDSFDAILGEMDKDDVRFKFEPDEPIFILRGHDRRAIAAIRHYQDHQSPSAPQNHVDAIASAVAAFDRYREENPGKLKEPD